MLSREGRVPTAGVPTSPGVHELARNHSHLLSNSQGDVTPEALFRALESESHLRRALKTHVANPLPSARTALAASLRALADDRAKITKNVASGIHTLRSVTVSHPIRLPATTSLRTEGILPPLYDALASHYPYFQPLVQAIAAPSGPESMDQLSIYPINESPVKMLVSQSGLLQTLVSLPTQQQSESQRPDASQTEPFLISSQPPHTSHLRTMAQPPPAKSIPNQMNRSTHQQYTPPAQSAVFAAPSPIQTGYYPPTRMHSAPIPLVPLANHNHVPMHHSVVVPLQAPESETTARPILPVPAIASKSMATMTEAQSTREMGTQTDPLPDPVQPPPPTYATQTITLRSNLIASVPKRSLPPSDEEDSPQPTATNNGKKDGFISALDKKLVEDRLKGIKPLPRTLPSQPTAAPVSKPSGLSKSNGKFRTPFKTEDPPAPPTKKAKEDDQEDDRLKNIDPAMIEAVRNEIMDRGGVKVEWADIAGLAHAKRTIQEAVIWPMSRPDIFNGLRAPPKGLLLFGPPGTGKTLIGKCIAGQSGATFFNISSSSLTSKWVGDGEKMVRALFAVARVEQPSVIFIDEIDSLLTQRTDGENEASRRIKTEFLVQFDGCGTSAEDRILLIGATNRPGEIDEAARRRFRKKLYIPLPEPEARLSLLNRLLSKQKNSLTVQQVQLVVAKTDGYSGSDIDGLVREACLGPIRRLGNNIMDVAVGDVDPMTLEDFEEALTQVRASVSEKDLEFYLQFDRDFGSSSGRRA